MELRYKYCKEKSEIIAASCFFLICFFKSFWYLDIANIFLRLMMFTGVLIAFIISRPRSFIKMSKQEIIWLIALGVPIMSRVFRTYEGNNINETMGFTTFYLCATIFALSCARNKALIKASRRVMSIYLSMLVTCTILFKFVPQFYLDHVLTMFNRQEELLRGYLTGNMSGLTSHYSTNALYMALAVMLVTSSIIIKKDKFIYKMNLYAVFILTLTALLMTGKRGQLIFSAVAIIVSYYFYTVDQSQIRIFKILFKIMFFILIIYAAYINMPDVFSSVTRMVTKMDSEDVTTGRVELWKQAIEYFRSYPLAGIGFKQFLRITDLDVHNIYLQFLCETGIAGTIIYLTALYSTLKMSFKNLISARKYHLYKNCGDEFFLLFSFMYQVFFLTYGITGNPFYDLPTLFPYMLSMGVTLYYKDDITFKRIGMGAEG